MTSINSLKPDPLADYRVGQDSASAVKTSGSNELGKSQFLELMIAQLNNQSPLDPQDNGAFVSQLAEFSALEQMQQLNGSFNGFSNQYRSTQALQASAMVGRSVMVPAATSPLNAQGGIAGIVDLPSSTGNLSVSIFNQSGELVNRFNLGQQSAGSIPFLWDGTNSNGEKMPFDDYTIKAEANLKGTATQVTTLLSSNVNSVSISQTGAITLNLSGMGSVPLEDVREIN